MKRYLVITVMMLAVLALTLAACSEPAEAPAPAQTSVPTQTPAKTEAPAVEPIVLNHNEMGGTTNKPLAVPTQFFADEVAKRTDGRVTMKIFWSGALASPPEAYDAVLKGICNSSTIITAYAPGTFPSSEAVNLPLGWSSSYASSHAVTDLYREYKPKDFDALVVPLTFAQPASCIGTVDTPVRVVDDLKGLNLRTTGGRVVHFAEALGITPKMMPLSQAYEALSKSVVDGVIVPMEAYHGYKLYEVIKYATDMSFASYNSMIIWGINKDTWNKISAQDQQTIMQLSNETMEMIGKLYDEGQETTKQEFLAMPGREYIEFSPEEKTKFEETVKVVIDQYIEERSDVCPAEEYVNYLKERLAYWSTH